MKLTTAINHKDRAERALADLWSSAKTFKLSHAEILNRRQVILDSIAHCPEWVKSYLSGQSTLYLKWHYQYMEFCYLVDDVLYSTSRKTERRQTEEFYSAGKGSILCDAPGNFYYLNSDRAF